MTLHLLPNLLCDSCDHRLFLPAHVDVVMTTLDGLIAESVSGGRRYLKRFTTKRPPHEMPIALVGEDPDFLLEPIQGQQQWGLVSDAGLPCLADPGAALVRRAQQLHLPIQTYPGPSSITMALVLSGLPAQSFTFHGYLPKEPTHRKQTLIVLEKRSEEERSTQIFIEAPYRNAHTFAACLEFLHPQTWMTVGVELTAPTQFLDTRRIAEWRVHPLTLTKTPAIFLIRRAL